MIKKLFIVLILTVITFLPMQGVRLQAQEEDVAAIAESQASMPDEQIISIDVFVRDTCLHCKKEKEFLKDLTDKRSDINVIFHDLEDKDSQKKWHKITDINNAPKQTPVTYVGNTIIVGFDSGETTGKKILELIDYSKTKNDILTLEEHLERGLPGENLFEKDSACDDECVIEKEYLITAPLLGVINLYDYSLPILSIILGFVDGFNPCAMWVLVTFLLILTQIGDKKKMWQFVGVFIVAEALMYYGILNVWITTWDFVGLDQIITPIIGSVAIGAGIFFLYEYKSSGNVCKVVSFEKQAKVTSKLQALVARKFGIATFFGILALAFSVNIIEFACSIGIPQAFTKILELNLIDGAARQGYMLIYILFYMIDDFIVFGIGLYAIDKIHLTTKYSKLSNLIGGILMIILGLLLLFKREWLVF